MRVTVMFWLHFLCVDNIEGEKITSFPTCSIFCLTQIKLQHFLPWLTWAIFIHRDRQLSWWFHSFQWDMQLKYTKTGNLHHNFWSSDIISHQDRQACGQFYDLNETRNFYRVDILHFPGTLQKKQKNHNNNNTKG